MKLFWKIFFTTMFISTVSVTISGCLLIDAAFNSGLEGEYKIVQDYGEIVYYSLANEFDVAGFSSIAASYTLSDEEIYQIVQSMSVNTAHQTLSFALINKDGGYIFSSLEVSLDKSIVQSLDSYRGGMMLKEQEGKYYAQSMRPVYYANSLFYIETVRDVTHIFDSQKQQYEMMIRIILLMLACAGALTFVMSKVLVRRIVSLTEITKTISDGNLSERANTGGQDEIALLSENFNQMADRLEEKIHELEEEAERKELFIGSFAHELKTPLTSIIGYSDLLRRKEMDKDKRHTCAEYIFTEGRRLEMLSMRLLDLIVMKNYELSPKPVRIDRLMEEVRAVISPQNEEANIRLVMDVEQAVIPMEAELMKTVFINLLDNARKAMERGGTVIVKGERKPEAYVLTISDEGKGMEMQELTKITEAFYMVDKSRARKQGGTGLGLAICREIISLHGFELAFDSTVNKGTTVMVTMGEQENE